MVLCITIHIQYAGHEIVNLLKGKLTPCSLVEEHRRHLSATLQGVTCQKTVTL